MGTKSTKTTVRAGEHLGEDVVLAVRARVCAPHRPGADRSAADGTEPTADSRAAIPVLGFPIIPLVRGVKNAARDLVPGRPDARRVLAFTASGDRVLLDRPHPWQRRSPNVLRRVDADTPVSVDLPLLYEDLIPEIELDGTHYLVNSVDFGVLTRAVVDGTLDEPDLAAQLEPYHRQAQAATGGEPETVRDMISGAR